MDSTEEKHHQIAQPRGRIPPAHALAERVTVGATERLPAQVRWIPEDAVESTPIHDLRELQKPVEEPPLLAQYAGGVSALPLRYQATSPVAAETRRQ